MMAGIISRAASAQAYPSRPIVMIVPIAADSSADVSGRLVAERMGAALGQLIIIEKRAWGRRHHWRRPCRSRHGPMAIRSSLDFKARMF
jgi:hypothetical protein